MNLLAIACNLTDMVDYVDIASSCRWAFKSGFDPHIWHGICIYILCLPYP